MDALFVCHLARKSSLVCRPRSSYRTSLSGLPCGLPRGVENVMRNQAICRRSWVYSSPSHRSDSITYFQGFRFEQKRSHHVLDGL